MIPLLTGCFPSNWRHFGSCTFQNFSPLLLLPYLQSLYLCLPVANSQSGSGLVASGRWQAAAHHPTCAGFALPLLLPSFSCSKPVLIFSSLSNLRKPQAELQFLCPCCLPCGIIHYSCGDGRCTIATWQAEQAAHMKQKNFREPNILFFLCY